MLILVTARHSMRILPLFSLRSVACAPARCARPARDCLRMCIRRVYLIFEDMDRVGDPRRGLCRFGARDGSKRRYRVWVGLVDVTTERSLQIIWHVRRGARGRVRSHRFVTLAMEAREVGVLSSPVVRW